MAEVKQTQITLPSGREIKGNIITAFQSTDKNFLISYLDDPSVPQPEGMVNLSVSLLDGNTVTGIEKSDTATWDPLRDYMRGIITGASYPASYISDVPSMLSANAELYARHIAVTPDQKDILQNDYITKTAVKEVAPVEPTPVVQAEEPVVVQEPVVSAPTVAQTSVVEEQVTPAEPVSVFESAPVMEESTVAPVEPVQEVAAPQVTPVTEPVIETPVANTESTSTFDLGKMKEEFMNSVGQLFDQTFAELSKMGEKMAQMEQELNSKLANANQMLADAEEAKKDAEAKAAVATVAFNNAQSLNQAPAMEAVVQLPTPEGPVLTKTNA